MRKKLYEGLGEVKSIAEGDLEVGLRGEGYKVYKPDWPRFLVVTPEGEVRLVELINRGKRLSRKKKRTIGLLQKMGFTTMVCYSNLERRELFKRIEEAAQRLQQERLGEEIKFENWLDKKQEPLQSATPVFSKIKDPNLAGLIVEREGDETESKVDIEREASPDNE